MSSGWLNRTLWLSACLGTAGAIALCDGATTSLHARSASLLVSLDSDGDLLTNDLEAVLLMDPEQVDSDGDSLDDFASAVTFVYPDPFIEDKTGGDPNQPIEISPPPPIDHALRVVVSGRTDPGGGDSVWLHYLFRFAGGTLPPIQQLDLWVDRCGVTGAMPLASFGGPIEFATLDGDEQGLYVRMSCRIGSQAEIRPFLPLTFGATMQVQGLTLQRAAMIVLASDGHIAHLTPVSTSSVVAVGLGSGPGQNPFWTADRVCAMTLSILSSTSSGHICEVTSAQCRPAGSLQCPPSCLSALGEILYIPDGMSTLTGGG